MALHADAADRIAEDPMPGDIVFALGALLMAWDFIIKPRTLFPRFVARLIPGVPAATGAIGGAE